MNFPQQKFWKKMKIFKSGNPICRWGPKTPPSHTLSLSPFSAYLPYDWSDLLIMWLNRMIPLVVYFRWYLLSSKGAHVLTRTKFIEDYVYKIVHNRSRIHHITLQPIGHTHNVKVLCQNSVKINRRVRFFW